MPTKKTATKTTVKKVKEAEIVEKTTIFKLIPRVTEKTFAASASRTYTFEVPAFASKQAIQKAVEDEFKVTVTSVRVLTRPGKKMRYSKGKHQYPGTTTRQDKKIAYVTVKKGDRLPIYDQVKQEMQQQAQQAAPQGNDQLDQAAKEAATIAKKQKEARAKKEAEEKAKEKGDK